MENLLLAAEAMEDAREKAQLRYAVDQDYIRTHLTKLRREKGLTYAEIARRIGSNRVSVRCLEIGTMHFTKDLVTKYIKALNMKKKFKKRTTKP